METVLFFPAYAYGHINRCFNIAGRLRDQYRVVFVSELKYKDLITSQGFEFRPLALSFSKVNHEQVDLWAFIKYFFFLIRRPDIRKNRRKSFLKEIDFFREVIKEINPKVVFLDIFLSHYFPVIDGLSTKGIIFQIYASTHRTSLNFPLNSDRVPENNLLGRLKSWVVWNNYFIKTWGNRLTVALLSMKTDNRSLFRLMYKNNGTEEGKVFDKNRAFFPGIRTAPEWVLTPQAFDFPGNRPLSNQTYFGLEVREDEYPDGVNESFERKWEQLPHKNIIYCSFGSIPDVHFQNSARFIELLCKIAEDSFPEYNFILSARGTELSSIDLPPNVHTFSWVPQQKILSASHLFITHGGSNSIMESLYYEVPMLVCPLNSIWDQPGNAARVVYHGLGQRFIPGKDHKEELGQKISGLLQRREQIISNIRKFKKAVNDQEICPLEKLKTDVR